MINKLRFFLFFLIFFLINSCDDNTIIFDSGESGINYFENSFVIDLEKSSFSSIPKYHINDSLLNQGLVPKLYIGNVGQFEEDIFSYALFEIDYNIIDNYSICDTSLVSIDNIEFTLKFDDSMYDSGQYMPNNDFYDTGGYQNSLTDISYNFFDIEENIDL